MIFRYCLEAPPTLCTQTLLIVARNLGLGVWAEPHLPPLRSSDAVSHNAIGSSEDYLIRACEVGPWYQRLNVAEDGVKPTGVL